MSNSIKICPSLHPSIWIEHSLFNAFLGYGCFQFLLSLSLIMCLKDDTAVFLDNATMKQSFALLVGPHYWEDHLILPRPCPLRKETICAS
jgi:hypothetical protein